jgi:tetratricopeptide (TPR) repeat protein
MPRDRYTPSPRESADLDELAELLGRFPAMAPEEQEHALSRVADEWPENDEVAATQATLLDAHGKRAEAIVAWDLAIALTAALPRAEYFAGRGRDHAALGRFAQALDDCSRAIVLDPVGQAHAYALRAVARLSFEHEESDEDLAEADFARAVELAPRDWECRYYRAEYFAEAGLYAEAVADLDVAIASKPDVGVLYELRGSCRARIEDELPDGWIEATLADFDRAVALGRKSEQLDFDRQIILRMQREAASGANLP